MDGLFRTGMWLAGRWCLIKRFLAVKPVRKVDRWCQVKVAMAANQRQVEKVFGLGEPLMGNEGVEVESTASEKRWEEKVERVVGKGKGVATETPSKEEKEEKVEFGSGAKWERGSLYGEPSAPKKEAKADLGWAVELGKLKVVKACDMGYCNKCHMVGGYIG